MKLTVYHTIKGRQVKGFKPGCPTNSAITQKTTAEPTVTLVMQMQILRIPKSNAQGVRRLCPDGIPVS